MRKYCPALGFPDWTNALAYPDGRTFEDPEDGSNQPRGWAWEFLRRNPDYQQDYNRSCTHDSGDADAAAAKYGLSLLLPYSYSGSTCLAMFRQLLALRELDDQSSRLPQFTEKQIALVFDVSLPLEPQLRAAKAQIAEKATRLGLVLQERSDARKRYANYPRYLRVLDAKAKGIRSKEIAEQFVLEKIFPANSPSDHIKQVDKYYERASELSRSGYLRIAYTSD